MHNSKNLMLFLCLLFLMYCRNTNRHSKASYRPETILYDVCISQALYCLVDLLKISLLLSDHLAVEARCQNEENALWIEIFLLTSMHDRGYFNKSHMKN